MSMNRLAIVAAIGTHNTMKNRTDDIRWNKHPSIEAHERPTQNTANGEVNMLLGGAILSVVLTIIVSLCYFCTRTLKRRDILYQQRWVHVDPNMDIYSVEQYYDISANNGIDEDQYTRILRNNGPPPSYEIAVAMKAPMKMELCHLCQDKVLLKCMSEAKDSEELESVNLAKQATDQFLNVKNISQHQKKLLPFCNCESNAYRNDDESTSENKNLTDEDIINGNSHEDDRHCQCASSYANVQICSECGKNIHARREQAASDEHDINANVPSTSGDGHFCHVSDINRNCEDSDEEELTDGEAEFDSLNENGLIRVDMRKLIDDQTGLPTYEAALKLESSGYV